MELFRIWLFISIFLLSGTLTSLFGISLKYMMNRIHVIIYTILAMICFVIAVFSLGNSITLLVSHNAPEKKIERLEQKYKKTELELQKLKQENQEPEKPVKHYKKPGLKFKKNIHQP